MLKIHTAREWNHGWQMLGTARNGEMFKEERTFHFAKMKITWKLNER